MSSRALSAPHGPQTLRNEARLVTFLRVSSCRFVAFYLTAFFCGLGPDLDRLKLCLPLSITYFAVLCCAGETLNRISDRAEDSINRPERTFLCESIGYRCLAQINVVLWGLLAALSLTWVAVQQRLSLAIALGLFYFLGINYSVGLRFKSKRHLGPLVLSATFWQPYLIGLTAGNGGFRHPVADTAFMLFIAAVFITMIGAKDITDVAGDRAIGYSSLGLSMLLNRNRVLVSSVVALPFVGLICVVWSGILPVRVLLLLAAAPVVGVVVMLMRRAIEAEQKSIVREFFYHVWMVFLLSATLVVSPRWMTVAMSCLLAAYWSLATRFLHWKNGLTIIDLRSLWSMFRGTST